MWVFQLAFMMDDTTQNSLVQFSWPTTTILGRGDSRWISRMQAQPDRPLKVPMERRPHGTKSQSIIVVWYLILLLHEAIGKCLMIVSFER